MSPIPASFLPPRPLWPDRIYTLPEHAGYPQRLNSTEELVDRHVEAGHGDRVAILYEDRRIKLPREVEFVPQLPRKPGPAGPGTGKLLRRVLREQAARG